MSGGEQKEDAQHRSDLKQCFTFVHNIFTMISVWLLSFLMEAVCLVTIPWELCIGKTGHHSDTAATCGCTVEEW